MAILYTGIWALPPILPPPPAPPPLFAALAFILSLSNKISPDVREALLK